MIIKTKQFFCKHEFKTYWKGKFGNLLFNKRYRQEDKKVIICIKCNKIKS